MFNSNIRGLLDRFVIGPYQLSPEGSQLVVDANASLSEEYFSHLDFPVSDFWFEYFCSKIRVLPPRTYGDVLDVCCGTGTLCLNVMKRGLFQRCVAIDGSAVAIDRLKSRTTELGIQVQAIHDDVMRPRFEEQSFDAVVGNSFLHHLPDNAKFLRQMHRLLRPGGTICFTGEPTIAANLLEGALMGTALRVLRAARIKKRPKTDTRWMSDIWVYEEKQIRHLLESCGFAEITVVPFGVLVPLFNGATAYVKGLFSERSLQPDLYWKYLGAVDKYAFARLPANWHSHFVIAARKG